MITQETIKTLATKYQTSECNIAGEYCQHLFLSYFYREKNSEEVLFKGGTALKIIYQSPRFSEDLDFSGFGISASSIEQLVESTLLEIEREGIEVDIKESTKTSGGYLAIINFSFLGHAVDVQLEISLRRKNETSGIVTLISSDLVPPYTVLQLPEEALVEEKIQALLSRKKPRDFYDLYFILRSRLPIPSRYKKGHELKKKIMEIIKKGKIDFKRELKLFLPVSHHQILRNFEAALKNEIERYL
ncbi:MAG: nucleotidyl transferase AbiEii/AbiGii toxin family protein [Actinomycetota bacterium]|nr:nucleotidyl transferase AbiEii/AbiGii toxin family protein [Actinomycetota bacterium]